MKRISLRDLIVPKRIELEDSSEDHRYGKFVAEPLERGFGVTIGNSIRRILLSSLQGAAITSIQVEGVMHEFSSIPGVATVLQTDNIESAVHIRNLAGHTRTKRAEEE